MTGATTTTRRPTSSAGSLSENPTRHGHERNQEGRMRVDPAETAHDDVGGDEGSLDGHHHGRDDEEEGEAAPAKAELSQRVGGEGGGHDLAANDERARDDAVHVHPREG